MYSAIDMQVNCYLQSLLNILSVSEDLDSLDFTAMREAKPKHSLGTNIHTGTVPGLITVTNNLILCLRIIRANLNID